MRRRHRWIRGDWQIASWLFRRVPGSDGHIEPNVLSPLSQWKILDNLRRSLVPAATTSLLCLGWTLLEPARFWTVAVIGLIALPAMIGWATELIGKASDQYWAAHLRTTLRSGGRRIAQLAFTLACLPFESYVTLDAIVRTTLRTVFTRRGLLQWTASGMERAHAGAASPRSYRSMWFSPVLALAMCALVARVRPEALAVAAPVMALWFISPLLAWWLSRPLSREKPRLDHAQTRFLRLIARRTWGFFENAIGDTDHWLPPDNIQENPDTVVAHRTSPTNIGLALLATLAAHDFGYLSTGALVERIGAHLRHAARHAAPPRTLLQLVRHANARAAAPAIRVDGRQRQPRRAPAHAAPRPDRARRRTHTAAPLAGRAGRHAGRAGLARSRGHGDAAGRPAGRDRPRACGRTRKPRCRAGVPRAHRPAEAPRPPRALAERRRGADVADCAGASVARCDRGSRRARAVERAAAGADALRVASPHRCDTDAARSGGIVSDALSRHRARARRGRPAGRGARLADRAGRVAASRLPKRRRSASPRSPRFPRTSIG